MRRRCSFTASALARLASRLWPPPGPAYTHFNARFGCASMFATAHECLWMCRPGLAHGHALRLRYPRLTIAAPAPPRRRGERAIYGRTNALGRPSAIPFRHVPSVPAFGCCATLTVASSWMARRPARLPSTRLPGPIFEDAREGGLAARRAIPASVRRSSVSALLWGGRTSVCGAGVVRAFERDRRAAGGGALVGAGLRVCRVLPQVVPTNDGAAAAGEHCIIVQYTGVKRETGQSLLAHGL